MACHIVGMEPKDQNLDWLEKAVRHLKAGKRLPIESSVLRHIFGTETADDAVDRARELAKRYHCEFCYNREQGWACFSRSG